MKGLRIILATCFFALSNYALKADQEPIKVGLIAPMTGPGAMMGRDMRDGALLAIDRFNAEGGLNGQKIKLIVMDDKAQPAIALNSAKKLIYQDTVFAVGTTYSPSSIAVIPLTKETETPQFIAGVAQKILEMDNPWIYRPTPSDSVLGGAYVTFAVKNLRLTKLAILSESTDYGKGGRDDLIKTLKSYNIEPLLVESYNIGDKDFAAQLNKIKNSGADGLFVWGLYVEGAQIVRQAKQLGLTMPILASSGVLQGAFLELAGKDAEGIYIQNYFDAKNPAPHVQVFVKEYNEKFKYEPKPGAGISYDAMTMLIGALKKVGSADKAKVIKEIKSTKFNGVIGRQECDNVGQCGRGALILQVKNGVPTVVWSSD
ncbi:MAG: ABC transporter substrate-binding protein [Bradyrhizobiaceae bacterium]|nr:ABC transporter substrate-binding protein [Bradyrhizobiaceae bacterium]